MKKSTALVSLVFVAGYAHAMEEKVKVPPLKLPGSPTATRRGSVSEEQKLIRTLSMSQKSLEILSQWKEVNRSRTSSDGGSQPVIEKQQSQSPRIAEYHQLRLKLEEPTTEVIANEALPLVITSPRMGKTGSPRSPRSSLGL